jgi:hypothetical protein
VAHGDALHLPQPEPEIGAVAHENGAFRTCVEQQGVPDAAGLGHQPQAEAQVRAQQRLARDHLRAGKNDVRELGDRKQGLADIGVAHVVGDDVDDERINWLECGTLRAGIGH